MTKEQEERLVVAFEHIGEALEKISGTGKQFYDKQFPPPRERRDAILSRIPTPEEKLKTEQGNTDIPLKDWLGELGYDDEEEIGPREAQYLRAQSRKGKSRPDASSKASPEASGSGKPSS